MGQTSAVRRAQDGANMSWLRVDDGFTEHPKAASLNDEQIGFWVRCACWAQRNPQFNGFVPRALLPSISKRSLEQAEVFADALVHATAGGFFKFGLWETVEGGWLFHDWETYQPPTEKLTREEAASRAGQRSAEVRRQRYGSAQPSNVRRSFDERSTEHSSNDVRPNVPRTSRTPDPEPDPDPIPKAVDAHLKTCQVPKPSERSGSSGNGDDPPKSSTRATEPPPAPQQSAPVLRLPNGLAARDALLAQAPQERAQWLEANQHQADWAQPQTWPEVVEAYAALHEAAGLAPPRLRHYAQEPGVRLLVGHFAAGHTREEIVEVYRRLPRSEWWLERVAEGKRPSAAWVTPEVFRRQLAGGNERQAARELARVRAVKARPALPSHRAFSDEPKTTGTVTAPPAEAWAALGGGR